MIGGFHVDDPTYCSGLVIGRSLTRLALQQIVGILPKWWAWAGGRGVTRVVARRAALNSRGRGTGFVKPMPS